MSTTSTYTAGGATTRVYYTISSDSDPTDRSLFVEGQFNANKTLPSSYTVYVYINGSQAATINGDNDVWVSEEGSAYASADYGWRKTYTKTHSSTSYTLTFKVKYKIGTTTYTSGTLSGTSFTVSAKPSYAVTYNANGGSNAPSSQTKWYGESLTLSSSKPYRNGYVFYHWNTSSSNTGTSYSPGASYTGNQALNLYAIWNPNITYNANGTNVSSLPANATKTYGVTYTIPSTAPIRNGHQFRYWTTNADGTGTTYQAGASYTSNVAVTLYAQWLKVADPPTISSMKVIRCDANGTADDMGTYCLVQARWSVDTTSAGMATNEGVLTGEISPAIGGSTTYTFYEGDSGTSGTAKALIENCDTDTTYTVSVTVTNSVIGTGQSAVLASTTADILSSSHFTMDFRKGGEAIGIGSAAPTSGLKVGWKAQFDEAVNIDGNITAANLKSVVLYNILDSMGTATVLATDTRLYKYGKLCHLLVTFKSSTTLSQGSLLSIGHMSSSAYQPVADAYCGTRDGVYMFTTSGYLSFKNTYSSTINAGTVLDVSIVYMSKA